MISTDGVYRDSSSLSNIDAVRGLGAYSQGHLAEIRPSMFFCLRSFSEKAFAAVDVQLAVSRLVPDGFSYRFRLLFLVPPGAPLGKQLDH